MYVLANFSSFEKLTAPSSFFLNQAALTYDEAMTRHVKKGESPRARTDRSGLANGECGEAVLVLRGWVACSAAVVGARSLASFTYVTACSKPTTTFFTPFRPADAAQRQHG